MNLNIIENFCCYNNITFENINELCRQNGITLDEILFLDYNMGPKEINDLIKQNKNIYCPKYMLFFHGTSKRLDEKINKDGLLPTSNSRKHSYQSQNGYVYLATYFDKAELFAEMGFSCTFENVSIYLVLLKTTELSIDTDQLNNQRHYNQKEIIKNTIGDSIYFGGSVRFKGKIDSYKFILIK